MLKPASLVFVLVFICSVQGQLALSALSQAEYDALVPLPDAPQFTLAGKAYYGKVQSVYDGDTVKILIKIGQSFQKFDCRLDWIDTPEVRTGVVKPFGAEVRDILSKMILGKIVRVEAGEFDKYGRVLTSIMGYTPGGELININTYLATHGMAKYYYGGTKEEFVQADYDYFIQNYRSTVWPVFTNYPYQTSY